MSQRRAIQFSRTFTIVAMMFIRSHHTGVVAFVSSPSFRRPFSGSHSLRVLSNIVTDTRTLLVDAPSWRDHPEIKKTLCFPTWVVPSPCCQKILSASVLQEYLGNVDQLHPKIKLVRGFNSKTHHLVLQHPDRRELSDEAIAFLESCNVLMDGPTIEIPVKHTNWTIAHVLHHVLPKKAHPPPTAFEQVGHVAHLNLRSHHVPYGKIIGEVLTEVHPNIETVVNKVGEVTGPFRTFDMEVLAGSNNTRVQVLENGVNLAFDIRSVYWCSRLSGEREYLLNKEFRRGEVVADPFCGVGALCVQAASKKRCRIWANDWNPKALHACKQNAARNNVSPRFEKVTCQDAYDFMVDIGLDSKRLPHHVVMNFPLGAPRYLESLRWWSLSMTKHDVVPNIHVYTFSHEDGARTAEEVAVDLVANGLLPLDGASAPSPFRMAELDRLGCDVRVRHVRDVAPSKPVMCVSFKVTKRLLRHIQGDFV